MLLPDVRQARPKVEARRSPYLALLLLALTQSSACVDTSSEPDPSSEDDGASTDESDSETEGPNAATDAEPNTTDAPEPGEMGTTDGENAPSGESTDPDEPGSARPRTDNPSTDADWSDGLSSGPNGPVPFIVVDQFGYRPEATKVAVIRAPQTGYDSDVEFDPGANYAVVNADGETVAQGEPVAWNGGAVDDASGDQVWWFDFSEVTAPGNYTIADLDNDVRSVEFEIDEGVYRSVLKHAVRSYYYQRAGFEKSAATVGADWADGASHVGPGQDSEARPWDAKDDGSQARDLHGGWYDAGDYNKYTAWAAATAISLLRAYDENPSAFGDDYDIAESNNGVPDILDEVKWSLDWIERMQNSDGSLLCILGLAGGSPPSSATEPSYYGPATTNATLMGAAVFAYASKVYGARAEPELQAYAEDLAERAERAWDWAEDNPNVTFYNNDDGRQPGSGGLGAGQQETDDDGRLISKFRAAVYLYEMTGDTMYQAFAEDNFRSIVPSWGPTQWDMDGQEVVLYYAELVGLDSDTGSEIVERFTTDMQEHDGQLPSVLQDTDPYRAPMQDYTWGSNQSKMAQAHLYQLLAKYGSGAAADSASVGAEEYVHYLHGVNPLGLVYLTNMQRAGAEHSAKTMYHSWFIGGTPWDEVSNSAPGPAPGFLVGGPNPSFALDSCCSAPSGDAAFQCYGAAEFSLCREDWAPPLNQPPQKSYLQFNDGWPAGSWPITEPSTGYQAKYVLVLSAYAR